VKALPLMIVSIIRVRTLEHLPILSHHHKGREGDYIRERELDEY
jgi:hypothetical protein